MFVVLSSGSFGTPGILERSGIGAKAIPEGLCEAARDAWHWQELLRFAPVA